MATDIRLNAAGSRWQQHIRSRLIAAMEPWLTEFLRAPVEDGIQSPAGKNGTAITINNVATAERE